MMRYFTITDWREQIYKCDLPKHVYVKNPMLNSSRAADVTRITQKDIKNLYWFDPDIKSWVLMSEQGVNVFFNQFIWGYVKELKKADVLLEIL